MVYTKAQTNYILISLGHANTTDSLCCIGDVMTFTTQLNKTAEVCKMFSTLRLYPILLS